MFLQWVAVDWGTTNLRAWIVGNDGAVQHSLSSDKGMNALQSDQFEAALLDLIAPYFLDGEKIDVLACGMVGARQGWAEAPYSGVPCVPAATAAAIKAPTTRAGLTVRILPGVCQKSPPDVMRGEETQLAGFLAQQPDFDGVACMPGTHTKWVRLSAGEIVSFQTFMTGEMFGLLAQQSVLRHSVTGEVLDAELFLGAVDDALSRPEAIGASLFGIRADTLVNGATQDAGRARLSGSLIGLELAGARPYWLGQDIAIIGAGKLSALYQQALKHQGAAVSVCDADELVLDGLRAAHAAERE